MQRQCIVEETRRGRGGQKNRWEDGIKNWVGLIPSSQRSVENGTTWKLTVAKCQPCSNNHQGLRIDCDGVYVLLRRIETNVLDITDSCAHLS